LAGSEKAIPEDGATKDRPSLLESGGGEGLDNLVRFGGYFAFGVVVDELFEAAAGFGFAVELVEAAAVVEEDHV